MGKRILIVDDEKDITIVVQARLKNAGYDVECAYDGKEALEKIKAQKPDLAILDIMMPEINGSTLCGMLKFDDRYKDMPIILLTAKGGDLDKQIGETVGADAYIVKPFEAKELIEVVENLLG